MAAADSAVEKPVSDEELIGQVCDGDRTAFDLLYERYFPRVCGYVNRRLSNRADAEETVQEVFIAVFSSLRSYRGDAPFAAWTLGVARRIVASRFKRKQHVTVPLEDPALGEFGDPLGRAHSDSPSPLENYECAERIRRMEEASGDLTPDQLRLFELHHLEHHSIRKIARDLDKSEDAVKSHLYRARKLLLAR